MAGAADWVAEQRRIKVEAQASAAALKNSNDGFDKISKSLRNVTPESERAARALDQMSQRLRTQNSVMGAAIGAAAGAFSVRAAEGLASQASPNGLNSVDKAFSILSGTIGSLLLPGFVLLGAVALTAADSIQEWIDENFDEIVDDWATAIEGAIKGTQSLTAGAVAFYNWVQSHTPDLNLPGALGELHKANARGQDLDAQIQLGNRMRALGMPRPDLQPGGAAGRAPGIEAWDKADLGAGRGGGGGGMAEIIKNARMIGNEMQQMMGPGSHISDPTGMWKQIAMQTANSELEARKMAMNQKGLDLLQGVLNVLERRNGGAGGQGGAAIGGRVRRAAP